MSKKKATMTLKDFHGGSIPSDLPLPSAPGVIVRPSERNNNDRQIAWGNPMGRSDHRLRPGSAGTLRSFDESSPFLNHNSHIGRNFDEDERKPLDGISGPRRIVSDDSFHGSASRVVEPKLDYSGPAKSASQLGSTSGKQNLNGLGTTNYTGRVVDVNSSVTASVGFSGSSGVGLNHQNSGGPRGEMGSGSSSNAWGLRKEASVLKEPSRALSSGMDAAVKLAHASALEKVSSGRWHSKQPTTSHPDVELSHHSEAAGEFYNKEKVVHNKNAYSTPVVGEGIDFQNVTLSKQREGSLSIDDGIRYDGKNAPGCEGTKPSIHVVANGRTGSGSFNGPQLPHVILQSRGSELQSALPSDASERPKLKLLPRSKPLDTVELPLDYNQGYQNSPVRAENLCVSHGKDDLKAAFVGSENENTTIERPKLNLKPRSEPLDYFDGKRNMLFGGARPRELVLKERGVDNTSAEYEDLGQPSNWAKQDNNLKVEKRSVVATSVEHTEKPDNIAIEQRKGKNYDKRDHHRLESEKTIDVQRRNWRGDENWRNKREPEKLHNSINSQQLVQQEKRPPSPETWRRKPVEQAPSQLSASSSGVRNVKAASAVELAQAFSRSISDPNVPDGGGQQRGLPNRQVPFSRLMEPIPRPQINGY